MMGDLLEYFEAQSRNLDEMSASINSPLPTNFTSCIRFNGIPILPPVMTQKRREEMLTYRRQAMKLENRRKSKQREKLVAKVQSIVAEVEEKQKNRMSDSFDSSPVSSGTDVSSKWSPESANSSKSPSGAPQNAGDKVKNPSRSADKKSVVKEKSKIVSSGTDKNKQQQSDRVVKEQRTKIPAPVQHTTKTPQKSKGKPSPKSQRNALSNLKKSSSMSSLPNPAKIPGTPSYPVPKPPATKMTEMQQRRSSLLLTGRLSFSNPDLRDFDDDNSLSCKSEGGVPRNSRKLKSKSAWQKSNQHSASDPDISRNEIAESQGFNLSPEDPVLKSPQIHRLQKNQRTAGSNPELSSTNYSPEIDTEQLRQEYLDSQKNKQKSENKAKIDMKVPAKDHQPKLQQVKYEANSEEPHSLNDLPSLDDCNSLPHEFSGLPLTSVKQQQIGKVLAKLSQCLNLQDTGGTLNSTSSSSSTENNAKQSVETKGQVPQNKNMEEERKKRYLPSPTLTDNTGNSGRSEAMATALNQSAVNSSVVSSVGSVGTNQSRRMSPKGLKNTVHFSSFVTEISTSASQSVEDKISVRKMEITPTNSVEFAESAGVLNSSEARGQGQYGKPVPKNVNDLGSPAPQVKVPYSQPVNSLIPGQPGTMLSKVALSPDESPGSGPKTFFKDQEVPFHVYTAEIEHNTSDKENENIYQNRFSSEIPDKLQILERELHKNCEQTYGNVFMLTGKRSNESDDRSQGSTLKESQENIILSGHKPYLSSEVFSDSNKTDFEKVMKVSFAVTGSSGHVTGDVSQSNRFSQGMSAAIDKTSPLSNSSKTVPKQVAGHVRHGSYTLDRPSDALINSCSNQQNIQYASQQNFTRMNIGPENIEPLSISQNDMNIPTSESNEQSAKAEHIQRYLSQVQNQRVEDELENQQPLQSGNVNVRQYEIGEAVRSFTETLKSMDTFTEEEMLKIQADHFNKIRQHLIEQQKQQLEELFVQQRREQMNLQEEIEMHHKHLREQQELFSSFSEANNLSQYSVDNLQNTSINSYNAPGNQFVNPNNRVPMNIGNSFNSGASHQQYSQHNMVNRYNPNTCVANSAINMYIPPGSNSGYIPSTSGNGYIPTTGNGYFPNDSVISNIHGNINQPVFSQQTPANFPTQQKQFSYIPSPSLYFNPKDRDNESDISTFSKVTPKQSLKFNQSTPSPKSNQPSQQAPTKSFQPPQQSSPKVYKPVQHSPVKNVPHAWTSSTLAFPEAAFDPRLQHCFDRVSAYVKGYLTRRLLVTEKVQEIVKTIDDTKNFARSFQQETPIKKGQVNHQDRDLLDRIIAQLQAALLDIHEIFFDIPAWERMQLIAHDRQLREERRLRESGATTRSSVSTSQPRISSATLKAMERKRKAQEAEMSVFGEIRPRTAPPVNERCQRESMDIRALQPVHTSHSHNTAQQSGNTAARIKTRPKTAPSQPVQQQPQTTQPTTNSSNQQTTTAAKTRKTSSTVSAKSTAAVAPKKKTTGKAWR